MESIELADVKGDGKVRSCDQKQTVYVQCNIVARSCNLFRHGNATVLSVLIVELRMSLSVLEKRSILL
jgi:hypothetical protein